MEQTEKNNQLEEVFTISTDTLPKITPQPFCVLFSWKEKSISVQLDNGEDVIKLAHLFSDFLTKNGIPNNVTDK